MITDPLQPGQPPLPWERQPGETAKAFQAFRAYRDLYPPRDRSVLAAYRQAKGKPHARRAAGIWNRWCAEHAWVERAHAYDLHREQLERQAREETWRVRAAQVADTEWDLAQQLIERAREMLRLPLVEQRLERDGRTIIIKPTRWSAGDVRGYAELASRLMRLATGKPTDQQALTGADGEPLIPPALDLGGLSDDEITTLLALLDKATRGDPAADGATRGAQESPPN